MDLITDAVRYLGPTLNNIITAIIILLIGFIIAKLVGRLVQRVLHEAELDNLLKKAGAKVSFEAAISHIAAEEIHYLMTRGLPKDQAVSMITRGFMDIEIPGLPPALRMQIDRAIDETTKEAM